MIPSDRTRLPPHFPLHVGDQKSGGGDNQHHPILILFCLEIRPSEFSWMHKKKSLTVRKELEQITPNCGQKNPYLLLKKQFKIK